VPGPCFSTCLGLLVHFWGPMNLWLQSRYIRSILFDLTWNLIGLIAPEIRDCIFSSCLVSEILLTFSHFCFHIRKKLATSVLRRPKVLCNRGFLPCMKFLLLFSNHISTMRRHSIWYFAVGNVILEFCQRSLRGRTN